MHRGYNIVPYLSVRKGPPVGAVGNHLVKVSVVSVAEAYPKRPGAFVPRLETIAGFRALLSGAYDRFPEEPFLVRGTLDIR